MITENYIKMCEKAEKIQKEWKKKRYDYAYCGETKLIKLCCDISYWETRIDLIFLPTQEQLFEIFSCLCNTNNKAHPEHLAGDHLPTHFINEIHNYLKKEKEYFTKEICLKIIMEDFYNKIWNGKDWKK